MAFPEQPALGALCSGPAGSSPHSGHHVTLQKAQSWHSQSPGCQGRGLRVPILFAPLLPCTPSCDPAQVPGALVAHSLICPTARTFLTVPSWGPGQGNAEATGRCCPDPAAPAGGSRAHRASLLGRGQWKATAYPLPASERRDGRSMGRRRGKWARHHEEERGGTGGPGTWPGRPQTKRPRFRARWPRLRGPGQQLPSLGRGARMLLGGALGPAPRRSLPRGIRAPADTGSGPAPSSARSLCAATREPAFLLPGIPGPAPRPHPRTPHPGARPARWGRGCGSGGTEGPGAAASPVYSRCSPPRSRYMW